MHTENKSKRVRGTLTKQMQCKLFFKASLPFVIIIFHSWTIDYANDAFLCLLDTWMQSGR